jgi:hypothetical protein
MNVSARGRGRKCKRKEAAERANQYKDARVSVQRTDADLGHQRNASNVRES